jgi:hypothetical protein
MIELRGAMRRATWGVAAVQIPKRPATPLAAAPRQLSGVLNGLDTVTYQNVRGVL